MLINYWQCPYQNFDERIEGDDEVIPVYGCIHPRGCETCLLDNKFGGDQADCQALDPDCKQLLIKFIEHLALVEGVNLACNSGMSPYNIGEKEYKPEEVKFLDEQIFKPIRDRVKKYKI